MQNITTKEEFDRLIGGEKKVIINFWTQSIYTCIPFNRKFEDLRLEHQEYFIFAQVLIDEAPEIVKVVELSKLPYFGIWEEGKLIGGHVGCNETGLKWFLHDYVY